jgi:hypothetical protein
MAARSASRHEQEAAMDKDRDKLPSGRNTHVKGTHKHAGSKTPAGTKTGMQKAGERKEREERQ